MLKDDAVQKQAPRIDAIKIQGGGGRGGLQNYRTLGTALHAFLVDSPGAWEAPYKCPCGSEHPRGGCAPPPPAPTLSFPAPPSRCSSSARRMRCVVELTLCGGGRAFKRCAGLQPTRLRPLRVVTLSSLLPCSPARRLRLTLHLYAHSG